MRCSHKFFYKPQLHFTAVAGAWRGRGVGWRPANSEACLRCRVAKRSHASLPQLSCVLFLHTRAVSEEVISRCLYNISGRSAVAVPHRWLELRICLSEALNINVLTRSQRHRETEQAASSQATTHPHTFSFAPHLCPSLVPGDKLKTRQCDGWFWGGLPANVQEEWKDGSRKEERGRNTGESQVGEK